MATLLRTLLRLVKLDTPATQPKLGVLYDTPEGLQLEDYRILTQNNDGGFSGFSRSAIQKAIGGHLALDIDEGEALDTVLNDFRTNFLRPLAMQKLGIVPAMALPSGKYSMSGATGVVTLEPFDSIFSQGNVLVAAGVRNSSDPVIWIRNDIVPYMTQGENIGNTAPNPTAESNYSNHKVIDGGRGTIIIAGNNSPSVPALRIGNADGVWGSPNFTGGSYRTCHLLEVASLHIMFMGIGIQLTNNNVFCINFDNLWVSSCAIGIQTSASAAETNAYEMHRFTRYFSGNINDTHIECNSTGNRDHQMAFSSFSLTYCAGPVMRLKTTAKARLEFTMGRFENFTSVVDGQAIAPRTWIVLNGMTIIPTNTIRADPKTTHLRKMFKSIAGGETYTVQATNTRFDITGTPAWSDDIFNDLGNMFLADENVVVDAVNTWAIEPVGDMAANNGMRNQPIWQQKQSLLENWNFNADGAGWTLSGGAAAGVTYSSTAGDFFFGTKGMKITFATNTLAVLSKKFRVEPGKSYYADMGGRYSTDGTTQCYVFFTWTWYAEDGTTVLGSPVVRVQSTQQNWFNRRSLTSFKRHPTGSGRVRSPAGAAFATVQVDFSANPTATGGNLLGTFILDCVIPIKQ